MYFAHSATTVVVKWKSKMLAAVEKKSSSQERHFLEQLYKSKYLPSSPSLPCNL